MRREIIFGLAGFAGGIVVGSVATTAITKRKNKKTRVEVEVPVLQKDLDKEEADNETEVERLVVTPEELEKFKEIIANEGYGDDSEDEEEESEDEDPALNEDQADYEYPQDDDDEEAALRASIRMKEQIAKWKKENEGKIEMIDEDTYDPYSDFPQDDYQPMELFYFKHEDVLTDEDGNILEPMEKWVGDIFTKTRFKTNDWQTLYIRNHPREEKYKVNKPCREYHDTETGRDVLEFVKMDEFFF